MDKLRTKVCKKNFSEIFLTKQLHLYKVIKIKFQGGVGAVGWLLDICATCRRLNPHTVQIWPTDSCNNYL